MSPGPRSDFSLTVGAKAPVIFMHNWIWKGSILTLSIGPRKSIVNTGNLKFRASGRESKFSFLAIGLEPKSQRKRPSNTFGHASIYIYICIYASKVKEHAQMNFTIYVCIYNYIHISLFASHRRLACVLVAGFRGFAIAAILPELGDFLPTLPPRENSL